MGKHTIDTERAFMRDLIGDDDVADALSDVIARVVRTVRFIDGGVALPDLKMAVHNSVVVQARDPEIKRAREAARDAAKFSGTVGDRVKIVNVSPKYLAGITGTVTEDLGDRVVIVVDEDHAWVTATRYSSTGTMRVDRRQLAALPA